MERKRNDTPKIGDRVGAVLDVHDGVVRLFGYGTYIGEEIPNEKVSGFGSILRTSNIPNPKIQLDSGKDVFGCECWWTFEDVVQTMTSIKKVVIVDIDEIRSKSN